MSLAGVSLEFLSVAKMDLSSESAAAAAAGDDQAAVRSFQEFLRIRSISGEGPQGSYQQSVDWLGSYITTHLQLPIEVISPLEGKPVLIAKWAGTGASSLGSVVLNSHYDVVPVMPEYWERDAFAGERTEDGRIHGRGAQDMK